MIHSYSRFCCYRTNTMGGYRLTVRKSCVCPGFGWEGEPAAVWFLVACQHCHKWPVWRMLRLVFWACSSLASFIFCSLLNRLQIGLRLLNSLFHVSSVLFLEGYSWGSFAKTHKLNQSTFWMMPESTFFERQMDFHCLWSGTIIFGRRILTMH